MPKPLLDTARVLVGDKTAMNGQLIAEALAKDDRVEICGSWSSSTAILAAVGASKPDIVLLSAHLEDGSDKGFEVARSLRSFQPEVLSVMLLDVSDRTSVFEAFRCGARGVFSRSQSVKLLAKCVHCVRMGQVWANSAELCFLVDILREGSTLPNLLGKCEDLSRREYDVVQDVARGLTNREIAQHLGLSEHTIKNYLFRIFDKLGVSTRVELVLHTLASPRPPSVGKITVTGASSNQSNQKTATYRRENRSLSARNHPISDGYN